MIPPNGCVKQDKGFRALHLAYSQKSRRRKPAPTPPLVDEFQKWILNWMAGHFGKTDRGLGRFLRSALPFLKRN